MKRARPPRRTGSRAESRPAPRATFDAFAVAAPGLEPFVAQELVDLRIKGTVVEGGVEFTATRRQLYEANLHLRTASRVVVRLAQFRALSFAELEKRARSIPWEIVLGQGEAVAIRVTCRKSRLYHSDAVAERVARDLQDRFAARTTISGSDSFMGSDSRLHSDPVKEPDPGQLIVVRFDHDRCTVSADSSGAHLHLRGYRTSVTEAPMRETLAAALIMASGWDRKSPLLDPFCGSGTIPIEAAMMAARLAPGRLRDFRFTRWPGFEQSQWDQVRAASTRGERRENLPPISGSDRNSGAIRAARENAARAGVSDIVELEAVDVEEVGYDETHGWVVSNPPYGVRLGDVRDANRLMSQFGEVLSQRFAGWNVGILAPNQLDRSLGFRLESRAKTTNGGLRVQVLTGTVPVTRPTTVG
jgi:putative N6-adenine-specific DNA methylase